MGIVISTDLYCDIVRLASSSNSGSNRHIHYMNTFASTNFQEAAQTPHVSGFLVNAAAGIQSGTRQIKCLLASSSPRSELPRLCGLTSPPPNTSHSPVCLQIIYTQPTPRRLKPPTHNPTQPIASHRTKDRTLLSNHAHARAIEHPSNRPLRAPSGSSSITHRYANANTDIIDSLPFGWRAIYSAAYVQ